MRDAHGLDGRLFLTVSCGHRSIDWVCIALAWRALEVGIILGLGRRAQRVFLAAVIPESLVRLRHCEIATQKMEAQSTEELRSSLRRPLVAVL